MFSVVSIIAYHIRSIMAIDIWLKQYTELEEMLLAHKQEQIDLLEIQQRELEALMEVLEHRRLYPAKGE